MPSLRCIVHLRTKFVNGYVLNFNKGFGECPHNIAEFSTSNKFKNHWTMICVLGVNECQVKKKQVGLLQRITINKMKELNATTKAWLTIYILNKMNKILDTDSPMWEILSSMKIKTKSS